MSIEPITADAPSIRSATPERIPTEAMTRVVGAVALAAVAIIRVLDLPGTLDETPLIGYGYFLLIAGALACAVGLMAVRGPGVWALGLEIAALFTEAVIVLLAVWRVRPGLPRPAQRQR